MQPQCMPVSSRLTGHIRLVYSCLQQHRHTKQAGRQYLGCNEHSCSADSTSNHNKQKYEQVTHWVQLLTGTGRSIHKKYYKHHKHQAYYKHQKHSLHCDCIQPHRNMHGTPNAQPLSVLHARTHMYESASRLGKTAQQMSAVKNSRSMCL
jgi:hypothetical protein